MWNAYKCVLGKPLIELETHHYKTHWHTIYPVARTFLSLYKSHLRPAFIYTMRVAQVFILASMALGVMAGCRRAPELCQSDVTAKDQGYLYGWACDIAEDRPCDTECMTTGSRQRDPAGEEATRCCKSECTVQLLSSIRSLDLELTHTFHRLTQNWKFPRLIQKGERIHSLLTLHLKVNSAYELGVSWTNKAMISMALFQGNSGYTAVVVLRASCT